MLGGHEAGDTRSLGVRDEHVPSARIGLVRQHHALVCDRLGQLSRLGAGRGAHVEDVHPGTAVEEFHRDHGHRLLLGDAAGGVQRAQQLPHLVVFAPALRPRQPPAGTAPSLGQPRDRLPAHLGQPCLRPSLVRSQRIHPDGLRKARVSSLEPRLGILAPALHRFPQQGLSGVGPAVVHHIPRSRRLDSRIGVRQTDEYDCSWPHRWRSAEAMSPAFQPYA